METSRGFNPEVLKGGKMDIAELANDPLRASDEVQKLMKQGKRKEANELLNAVLDAQRGGEKKEQRMAM